MMTGTFQKSALNMLLNPSFVSRICYLEKIEVLNTVDKISGILLNRCMDSKSSDSVLNFKDRVNANGVNCLDNTSFDSKKANDKSLVESGANFSYSRTLLSSDTHNFICNQGLSSFSSSRTYCTQTVVEDTLEAVNIRDKPEDDFTRNLQNVSSLFPLPQKILNDIFGVVEKKNPSHNPLLSIDLQIVKQKWSCSYKLKWPQKKTFIYIENTKKQATRNCAWLVLNYLLENKHINEKGVPVSLVNTEVVPYENPLNLNNCISAGENNLNCKSTMKFTDITRKSDIKSSHELVDDMKQNDFLKNIIELTVLFPKPKENLHKIYEVVKDGKKSLLTSTFAFEDSKWSCNYIVKWPHKKTFSYTDITKKSASKGCAWKILDYLSKNKYIDKKGNPKMKKEDKKIMNPLYCSYLLNYKVQDNSVLTPNVTLIEPSELTDTVVPKGLLDRLQEQYKPLQETNLSENIEELIKIFPYPKNTLNNIYETVQTEEKSSNLYSLTLDCVDQKWCCSYDLKWPKEMIVMYTDFTKKEASTKCAWLVLQYLLKNNHVDKSGTLISYKKGITTNTSKNNSLQKLSGQTLLSVKSLSPISSVNNFCTEIYKKSAEDKQIEAPTPLDKISKISNNISKMFPQPKNALDNIHRIIKKEKGLSGLLITSSFKSMNGKWSCTYDLKWPQENSFSYTDKTKKQASTRCAWLVLQYLFENKHIDKEGKPCLYGKEEIEKLVKESIPALKLNDKQMEKLNHIMELYTSQILPLLEYSRSSKIEDFVENNLYEQQRIYKPKFLGYNEYVCKEDIHLPISDYKEEIIQKIKQNRIVIVKGEPGCGKSTRLPQYILEGWVRDFEETGDNCNIIVTEPRRIAAISLADRVASERNEKVGKVIGYKVRFKSEFNKHMGRITYCTNGILLQHFKSDPNLSNYTHVVIDEAHERDVNTDLLLNMLREVLNKNPILKIIIMSATINTELFQNYFEGSDLIHIPGFTYPVKSHFLDNCSMKLEKTKKMCGEVEPSIHHDEITKVLMHIHEKKPEGAILCFLPGWEDIRKIRNSIPDRNNLIVLCLHSRLQDDEQWRIFKPAPPGVRKIILATNIAETSVTINDVVYVVDTGIHKETRFDIERGSMCIDNHWISKSNVEQRRGRAGRVKPGECFHLYPKSKLDSFPQFSLPEILRVSLTKVVLDTKAFQSDKKAIDFFNNLPSPPEKETVKLAVDELIELELLNANEELTPLGWILHHFQLEPKLAKTLVNSVIFKCVSPIVDIVTLFSAGIEMFRTGLEMKEDIRNMKTCYSNSSDHMSLMKIFEIWNQFLEDGNERKAQEFVEDLKLLPSKMHFLKALKEIHFNYVRDGLKPNVLPISDDFSDSDEMVKAVLLNSLGTFLTHRNWDIVKGRMKKSNVFLTRMNQKATVTPDSVNFKRIPKNTEFFLYINETRSNVRRITLIRESTLIPAVMVLLFTNKKLSVLDIDPKHFSSKLKSKDQVKIELADTKIGFILDREQALKIMECRLALTSCYDHYIFQLTEGGERNHNLDAVWSEVLEILNEFLADFKNE